jgi:hypothetical protein
MVTIGLCMLIHKAMDDTFASLFVEHYLLS